MKLSHFLFGKKPEMKQFETLSPEGKKAIEKLLGHFGKRDFDLSRESGFRTGESYLSNLLQQLGQPQQLMSESDKSAFAAPYLRQFREQIVPGIAERFSGLDAQGSSAFQNALGQAGSGLEEQLAQLAAQLSTQQQEFGLRRQALGLQGAGQALSYATTPIQALLQRLSLGLGTPSFGYTTTPGQTGFTQEALGGLLRFL